MVRGSEGGAAVSDEKMMEEVARANGIDPENFDYDEGLASQDLEVHDPTKKDK